MSVTAAWLVRARRAWFVLRFRPFDTSTLEGAALERDRRLLITTLASLGARFISVATALMTVPLTVHYLGKERYGLWGTMSGLIAMLQFADLGLGNGVLNLISEANGKNDLSLARRATSSASAMLVLVAAFLAVAFAAAYPLVPWPRVLGVESAQAREEAGPAMAVLAATFLVNMPLSVVIRTQNGYQEGLATNLWTGAGNLLGLALTLLAIKLQTGLPWLVAAMAGSPALATALNWIEFFWVRRRSLLPRKRFADRAMAERLLRMGAMFFALQMLWCLSFASDNWVIAQVLGAEHVTDIAVPLRLFGIVTMLLTIVVTPLWPAYGEAIARGDVAWIRRTFRYSMMLALFGAGFACAVLVLAGPWLLRLWVGPQVRASYWLLAGLGLWTVLQNVGACVAVLLNAANRLRVQILSGVGLVLVGVPAKVMGAKAFGVAGVPWTMLGAYALFVLVPQAFTLRSAYRAIAHGARPGQGAERHEADASVLPVAELQPSEPQGVEPGVRER